MTKRKFKRLTVSMLHSDWLGAKRIAKASGVNISDVFRQALAVYVSPKIDTATSQLLRQAIAEKEVRDAFPAGTVASVTISDSEE